MKNISLLSTKKNSPQRMTVILGFALTLIILRVNANPIDVDLGTANNFAVLAGSTITSTGASVINGGNVGLSPGTAITGFPPATITPPFTTFVADAVALQAQSDLTAAYNTAAGLAPNQIVTGQDLGGLTLTPGVYFFASSAQLTGVLTLNNEGNPDAVFVFQIGSTLTTASDSSVVTINDGSIPGLTPGISVFWQIGSSATLGTGTDFEGNILANTSITANTGATIDGRLLAENGAVTLDDNTITAPPAEIISGTSVPDSGSTLLLLGSSCAVLCSFRRRLRS
jgi:Ice-binding-like/VPDSG-CTERM motif